MVATPPASTEPNNRLPPAAPDAPTQAPPNRPRGLWTRAKNTMVGAALAGVAVGGGGLLTELPAHAEPPAALLSATQVEGQEERRIAAHVSVEGGGGAQTGVTGSNSEAVSGGVEAQIQIPVGGNVDLLLGGKGRFGQIWTRDFGNGGAFGIAGKGCAVFHNGALSSALCIDYDGPNSGFMAGDTRLLVSSDFELPIIPDVFGARLGMGVGYAGYQSDPLDSDSDQALGFTALGRAALWGSFGPFGILAGGEFGGVTGGGRPLLSQEAGANWAAPLDLHARLSWALGDRVDVYVDGKARFFEVTDFGNMDPALLSVNAGLLIRLGNL